MSQASTDSLRARLANERTLLAWLRTAIALMGFGVVVARFGVFLDTVAVVQGPHADGGASSRWMGAALLLTGTLVGLVGAWRTRVYARTIPVSEGAPGDGGLGLTTVVVALLGLGLTVWVVLMD